MSIFTVGSCSIIKSRYKDNSVIFVLLQCKQISSGQIVCTFYCITMHSFITDSHRRNNRKTTHSRGHMGLMQRRLNVDATS